MSMIKNIFKSPPRKKNALLYLHFSCAGIGKFPVALLWAAFLYVSHVK